MKKIAFCFFGQVKNYQLLHENYKNNLIDIIESTYSVDYYLHTNRLKNYYNPSINNNENHSIDYTSILPFYTFKDISYKLDYTLIKKIVEEYVSRFGVYWTKELTYTHGALTTEYAVRQLYGLNEIFQMVKNSGVTYDKYILTRPDLFFYDKITPKYLEYKEDISIPNFSHWYGYNDRFAITNLQGFITYTERLNYLLETPQQITSEKLLKKIIKLKKNTLRFIPQNFIFDLCRANGVCMRN